MKHSSWRRPVFIFAFMLFAEPQAYGTGQDLEPISPPTIKSTKYEIKSFSFFKFYSDRMYFFQTNIQDKHLQSAIKEFFFRQFSATPELITRQDSSSMYLEHLEYRQSGQDDVKYSRYAKWSDNLESPMVMHYKYKTTDNTLLSVILPIAATDHLTIIPMVSMIFCLKDLGKNDFRDTRLFQDKVNNILYGGINLIYSF